MASCAKYEMFWFDTLVMVGTGIQAPNCSLVMLSMIGTGAKGGNLEMMPMCGVVSVWVSWSLIWRWLSNGIIGVSLLASVMSLAEGLSGVSMKTSSEILLEQLTRGCLSDISLEVSEVVGDEVQLLPSSVNTSERLSSWSGFIDISF